MRWALSRPSLGRVRSLGYAYYLVRKHCHATYQRGLRSIARKHGQRFAMRTNVRTSSPSKWHGSAPPQNPSNKGASVAPDPCNTCSHVVEISIPWGLHSGVTANAVGLAVANNKENNMLLTDIAVEHTLVSKKNGVRQSYG